MSWYTPRRAATSAAGGIKLFKISEQGESHWGKRWVESLHTLCSAKRLEVGLRLAKSGHVLSIQLNRGFSTATVKGTRTHPYKIEIGLSMFTRKQWMNVADALLKKAFFTAKLLAGDLPPEMEQLFQSSGATLFPTSPAEISSDCSCTDVESPCKHVIAVYYILGQEIDRDPFLLMEMRGLSRAQLLAEIQTRRSARGKITDKKSIVTTVFEPPVPTRLSDRLNDFFRSPEGTTLIWPVEPDKPLLLPGSRIHEMGSPPFWNSDNDFEEILTRIYQAVRKRALG
jgi:uncharacterized Zn finger protein